MMALMIITVEAVYDASDIIEDYTNSFAAIAGGHEWYVCDHLGTNVTEAELRRAVAKLPIWVQKLSWAYTKAESYRGFPWGRIEATTEASYRGKPVRLVVTATNTSTFLMNFKLEIPFPASVEDFVHALPSVKLAEKYSPPLCPECGKPIKIVYEQIDESYTFNPETGSYDHDEKDDSMDIKCEDCGCGLSDVFPEGVCNFRAEALNPNLFWGE